LRGNWSRPWPCRTAEDLGWNSSSHRRQRYRQEPPGKANAEFVGPTIHRKRQQPPDLGDEWEGAQSPAHSGLTEEGRPDAPGADQRGEIERQVEVGHLGNLGEVEIGNC